METLENLLKFIGTYPAWAKSIIFVGIGLSVATLVFAPRDGLSQVKVPVGKDERIFMRVKAVQLYPPDPTTEVRLTIFVNDIEFVHPSVGGVKWMKVGPGMSEKIIELPKSSRYDIRFEMNLRSETQLKGGTKSIRTTVDARTDRATSQMITPVTKLPFSEDYKLYLVNDMSRAASVKAVIPYELYQQ